ncbi:helix-turn-helix transcriptional regulator [Saccharibacillus sacchari]|uniref:helix-turn-helix transcriptional regulator n=1 Tax=Saccharibacillus sacchari TaxID=456493 RepID=UPI00056C2E7A|nr:YafY family protein [Saccharibacillus sacchari]
MRTGRLVSTVMLLLERKRVGAQELAELFEVSRRTVYRDIEAINRAGIPVVSFPGVGGGFGIMERYKVDQRSFTVPELVALLTGLDGVASVLGGDEVSHALAKIQSLIPEQAAADLFRQAQSMRIDLRPWNGNDGSASLLKIVQSAIRQQRVVVFDYADRAGRTGERRVRPYRLLFKEHRYMQGFCLERQQFRLFRLSRMSELKVTEEQFEQTDKPPEAMDEFVERMSRNESDIELRVSEEAFPAVRDYCSWDRVEREGNFYRVRFPFVPDDAGYRLLLGFGAGCECVAPKPVRDELRKRVVALYRLYGEA